MLKKTAILASFFSLVAILGAWKISSTYEIYLSGEDAFLQRAHTISEAVKDGSSELSREQLASIYVLAAEAKPSRYGMKTYFFMTLVFFVGGLVMYIVGWIVGYKEGSRNG